jgi:glycosyltransferase involved in cell wall biosynthesis
VTGPSGSRLVVVDADVLGRRRTGDETYVSNLLRELPALVAGTDIAIAAVTRHPELVPDGVRALALPARSQELRMAFGLPRLLRRVDAALVHTQYALPVRCPCPAVVTIHDISFEGDPTLMGWRDRLVFRRVVPRSARRAARVLTVSERSRHDIETAYGIARERIVVTPNGVDARFSPGAGEHDYVLAVGAIQRRKNHRAALEAARAVGLPLVIVGPTRDPELARELEHGGARLEGYVAFERLVELYRGAACIVQPSRYEGFGLPIVEAMACGTPVVAVPEPALVEVGGDAAVFVDESRLADGIREALARRDELVQRGMERAARFTWRECASRTLEAYRAALADVRWGQTR